MVLHFRRMTRSHEEETNNTQQNVQIEPNLIHQKYDTNNIVQTLPHFYRSFHGQFPIDLWHPILARRGLSLVLFSITILLRLFAMKDVEEYSRLGISTSS